MASEQEIVVIKPEFKPERNKMREQGTGKKKRWHLHITTSLQTDAEEAVLNKKRSKSTQKKYEERKKTAKVENALEEQFSSGRVLGRAVYYTL